MKVWKYESVKVWKYESVSKLETIKPILHVEAGPKCTMYMLVMNVWRNFILFSLPGEISPNSTVHKNKVKSGDK